MTESLNPPDEALELVSAYLDGEADPAEVARVESDPTLLARVEELRGARASLKADATFVIDGDRREEAIATALAAFDAANVVHPTDAPEASVTSLIDVAARRTGASTRSLRIIAIAAVIALAALAVPLLASLGGDDDDEASFEATADASGDASDEPAYDSGGDTGGEEIAPEADNGGAGELQSPAAGSADGAPGTTAYGLFYRHVADLGTFSDLPELEDAVRAELTASRGQEEGGSGITDGDSAWNDAQATQCVTDAVNEAGSAGRSVSMTARADLEGRVVAVVVTAGDGGEVMTVIDLADCTEIANRTL